MVLKRSPAGLCKRTAGTCPVARADGVDSSVTRRSVLGLAVAAVAASFLPRGASAARPSKSNMTGNYKEDAARMLNDMKEATDLVRGSPNMSEVVSRTRQDMNDFVALYRRNNNVAGSTSYSTLYTATNTLSGHYASYGPNYPVPEKRKKRLHQQFNEIERALSRGR